MNRLEDGAEIAEYEGGTGSDNGTLEHIKLSPGDRISDLISPLAAPWDLEIFKERKEFISGLRYYVISLRRSDKPDDPILHAFRFFTERFELNRSRWVATLRGRGPGYYDEVKKHGFFFDYHIDCLCRGQDMFILNRDKFQRIFRFYEYVQDDAKTFVYGLQDRIPIANLDEFMAACKRDQRMAIRLGELSDQPHILRLSMARVKRAIDKRGLPVRTTFQNGKEMLVYATAYKTQFLHLLSDDYLSSPMTSIEYEASVKRAMKQRPGRNGHIADVRVVEESPLPYSMRRQRRQLSEVGNASLGSIMAEFE